MTESQGRFLKDILKGRDLEEGRGEDGLTIINKNLSLGYIINYDHFCYFHSIWMTSSIGDLYPFCLIDYMYICLSQSVMDTSLVGSKLYL